MIFFRFSKSYFLLKPFVVLAHKLFYRKIQVFGKDNIPKDSPVLFAPNHQNALMDPLAIICTNTRQITFLARADIFKKPVFRWILTRLKIIPVYRIRDGKDSLKKNDEVFDLCADILKHQKALALFPEGTHNDRRSLMSLKKAIPRIAFKAESGSDFYLGLKIVPVGINYSNYSNFRADLHVEYGQPISIAEYQALFTENEEKAYRQLAKEMRKGILPLMLHIEDSENHLLYENARQILPVTERNNSKSIQNLKDTRVEDQRFINDLYQTLKDDPEEHQSVKGDLEGYFSEMNHLGLRSWIFEKRPNRSKVYLSLIALLVLFPVHLYGTLNNLLIYQFVKKLVNKRVKDIQFHATFKFGVGLVLIPIVFLIQTTLVYTISNNIWIALIYLITLPLFGVFAFNYMIWWRKLNGVLRFLKLKKQNNKRLTNLISLRTNIIEKLKAISGQ